MESCNDTPFDTSDSHSENIITINHPQRAPDRLNIPSRAMHVGTCWEIYDYTQTAKCVLLCVSVCGLFPPCDSEESVRMVVILHLPQETEGGN